MIEEYIDYDWKGAYSYFTKALSPDIKAVYCFGSYWYSYFWRNISLPLNVTVGSAPVFNNTEDKLSLRLGSTNHILTCTAYGQPAPRLLWLKNGVKLSHTETNTPISSSISYHIHKVDHEQAGDYDCLAENLFGDKSHRFKVEITDDGANYWIAIGVPLIVFLCTGVGAYVYVKYFRQEKIGLTRQEIKEFLKGETGVISKDNEYAHEFAHLTPYTGEYEVSSTRFQVDQTCVLGSGAFEIVMKGIADGFPVAVKTIKKNADKSYLKALLSELKIMIYLGTHQNIIDLVGASTKGLDKGVVYVFVHYCSFGNLEKFLRSNRGQYLGVGQYENVQGSNTHGSRTFSFADLLSWSQQIAQGMSYLSVRKVIHGDLACRNILLNERMQIKITDFGLSRQLYGYASYVKKQQEPLPWRWMALESLRDLTFSVSSDVWAFGVTLWEIFSLGEVPYPGLNWTINFVEQLENGLRLEIPKHATETLYNNIMVECWREKPEDRNSFMDILQRFVTELIRWLLQCVNQCYQSLMLDGMDLKLG